MGPGRLETNGPGWWQTGGLIALEFAFGMSLGLFARRFDVARLRAMVPASLRDDEEYLRGDAEGLLAPGIPSSDRFAFEEDLAATMPVEPLREPGLSDEHPTIELDPLPELAPEPAYRLEPEPAPELAPEAERQPEYERQPGFEPVSYTHLDVYKRQICNSIVYTVYQ